MMVDFIAPDFVGDSSPEEIQRRMMESLPEDIDSQPGGFVYDFTMPTALEKSNLIQFHVVRTLMLMFPMWAWGEWLDLHGEQAGVGRKEANRASGEVTIDGMPGTRIPAGAILCTPSMDGSPSLDFQLDVDAVMPEDGSITAQVTAVVPGKASNVGPGSITLMARPIKGIAGIRNAEGLTGGTDAEEDGPYLGRIMEKYGSEGASYIGNDADLRRWAMEVSGIGDCIVVPAWDGPGTVKLVLVDSNGQPANGQLQQSVYDHIVSPDDREKRLLPTGSGELTVVAAETRPISYACNGLSLLEGADLEQVAARFQEGVLKYYVEAKAEGVVRYNRAHAILTRTDGVADFKGFLIDGQESNIVLERHEYPATGMIDFKA